MERNLVKKVGKRSRKKKSKNNMMKAYVDFVSLAHALSEANEEDIRDGSKIAENKRFADINAATVPASVGKAKHRKTKTVNLGNGLQGKVAKDKIEDVKTNYHGGRDTRNGKRSLQTIMSRDGKFSPRYDSTEPDALEKLTKQQENFIRIAQLMDTAEYYEVDPMITKHMQETDPLGISDAEFKLPFNRCFFSTNLKSELGKITGILVDRCSFYIVKDVTKGKYEATYTLSRENKEVCKCGKYKYEHNGISNHGAAEGCERFTWDGTKVAQEVDGYALYYRWDYQDEMYIKDSLIAFPQDSIDEEILNDSITTQTIKDFLVNLSFYLTIPERVYVEKQRDLQRRFETGRMPLPSSTYITCNNKLKIYLHKYEEALTEGGKAVRKHRRVAHWRKYTHKKFVNVPIVTRPDGSMGKYIWVRPTVVGSGMYIPRHRRVKE